MTMTTKALFVGLAAAALVGCATPEAGPSAANAAFDLTVTPDLSARAFVVSFTSRSDAALCMDVGDWPSDGGSDKGAVPVGSLNMASDRVFATVNGRRYPMADENFGICIPSANAQPDYCSRAFAPRTNATAVIPFDLFPAMPATAIGDDVGLAYAPKVWACENK